MDALDADLGEIVRRLPSAAVQHLRTVPIFLGVADPVTPCACYHKSPEWLAGAGFDPAKARSVEIANASTFLDWRRGQPSMVLHELSHAYHHQVLGTDDEDILAAFRAAADSGRFDRVVRHRGNVERHYALTNVDEYFAETSEALFGVNDFYPFLLGELLAVDPGGAAAVARAWKADTPTPMKPDLETCAAKEIPALHRFFDDWFAGRVDDTDGAFLRMESALAPGFRMVTPDGALRTRDEILGAVRAGHGVGDRNISATVIEVRLIDAVHALVVYEESQRSGTGEPRVLLSTALVQRSPGAPGGLLWVHVHETERAP